MEDASSEVSAGEVSDESARLAALRNYDVLDTPPEESFDRLTRLAARLFDVPVALISFVSAERQWTKSCFGLGLRETSREASFCAHAIESPQELTVAEDTREDPRFAGNPFVTGEPGVRFYAGAPLRAPEGGHALGAFAVIDMQPRTLVVEERQALKDLAAAAMDELELRRQLAERAQREERMRLLRSAVERANDSVLITESAPIDPPGPRIVYANEAFFRRTGYAPEEVIGANPRFLQAPEISRAKLDRLRAALEQEEPMRVEVLNQTKTGERYWAEMNISPVRGPNGEVTHFTSIQRDVTERRRREERIRESEARFRSVVENARDIIFRMDPGGALRLLSPSWETVTGHSAEASLGLPLAAFVHPEERSVVRERLRAHAAGEFSRNGKASRSAETAEGPPDLRVETRLVTAEGQTRPVEIHARRLTGDSLDGVEGGGVEVLGTTGTITDLTDTRRAEAEREARERAEELLAAKTALLNNVSHELRTPLASIIGLAEVLEEEAPDTGVQQEFAASIMQNGKRLQRTFESVLLVAQLDGDREGTQLDFSPVGVGAAVQKAAALHRPAAAKQGLAFEVEPPAPGEGDVYADLDEGALGRILDNLIGNALKFTDEGGVAVRVHASGEQVHIEVADTGIGIGEAFREHLFNEFQQESDGLNRTHEGSGLGLVIVQRLTHLMNGTIDVTSQQGNGSRFTVHFPRRNAPGQAISTPDAEAQSEGVA